MTLARSARSFAFSGQSSDEDPIGPAAMQAGQQAYDSGKAVIRWMNQPSGAGSGGGFPGGSGGGSGAGAGEAGGMEGAGGAVIV